MSDTNKPGLSGQLSPHSIVIWSSPVTKTEALTELGAAIAGENSQLDLAEGLRRIREREREMSSFLDEGVAVPHASIPGIDRIICALGIARYGVSDVQSKIPIHLIFMALYPPVRSTKYLRIMSSVAALSRDRKMTEQLCNSRTSTDALALIAEFESRSV